MELDFEALPDKCFFCMEVVEPTSSQEKYAMSICKFLGLGLNKDSLAFFRSVNYCDGCHAFLSEVDGMLKGLASVMKSMKDSRGHILELLHSNTQLIRLSPDPEGSYDNGETPGCTVVIKEENESDEGDEDESQSYFDENSADDFINSFAENDGESNSFAADNDGENPESDEAMDAEADFDQDSNASDEEMSEEEPRTRRSTRLTSEKPNPVKVKDEPDTEDDVENDEGSDFVPESAEDSDFDGDEIKGTDTETERRSTRTRRSTRSSNPLPFACTVPGCGRTYKERGGLTRHFQRNHATYGQSGDPRKFRCEDCDSKYCVVPEHRAQALECTYCRKLYSKYQRLSIEDHIYHRHNKKGEALERKCGVCSFGFYCLNNLEVHEALHRRSDFTTCVFSPCAEEHESVEGLRAHVEEKHKRPWENNYVCEVCSKEYNIIQNYEDHMRSHKNERPFVCRLPNCNKAYTTTSNRSAHERSQAAHGPKSAETERRKASLKRRQLQCPHCPLRFEIKDVFEAHIRRRHELDPKPYHCPAPACLRKFKGRSELNSHYQKIHVVIKIEEDSRLHKYRCREAGCAYHTTTQEFLDIHTLKVHQGEEKPYKCDRPGCTKAFRFNLPLQHHIQMDHEGPNLICEHCGEAFSSVHRRKLQDHIRLKHPQAQKFVCCVCTKIHYLPELLEAHESLHKNKRGKRPDLACVVYGCKTIPETLADLQAHVWAEHDDPDRVIPPPPPLQPVICDICGKTCNHKNNLATHIRRVHGPKRHQCSYCEKKFATGPQRAAHEEMAHLSKDDRTRKDYVCPDCGRVFHAKQYLHRHAARHRKGRVPRERVKRERLTLTQDPAADSSSADSDGSAYEAQTGGWTGSGFNSPQNLAQGSRSHAPPAAATMSFQEYMANMGLGQPFGPGRGAGAGNHFPSYY